MTQQETDREWILAHIEDYSRDGKYLGRKEVFNFYKPLLAGINNVDAIDLEIKNILEEVLGCANYSLCPNIQEKPDEVYCSKLNKKLGTSLSNVRKLCRSTHDYFTDCRKAEKKN